MEKDQSATIACELILKLDLMDGSQNLAALVNVPVVFSSVGVKLDPVLIIQRRSFKSEA